MASWSKIVIKNHIPEVNGQPANAMDSYDVKSETGAVTLVEYTLGYERHSDGKARIFLHDAAMSTAVAPAASAADAPITEQYVFVPIAVASPADVAQRVCVPIAVASRSPPAGLVRCILTLLARGLYEAVPDSPCRDGASPVVAAELFF